MPSDEARKLASEAVFGALEEGDAYIPAHFRHRIADRVADALWPLAVAEGVAEGRRQAAEAIRAFAEARRAGPAGWLYVDDAARLAEGSPDAENIHAAVSEFARLAEGSIPKDGG